MSGRRLTVLSVAYPLAAVGPDAVGGAEQVLSSLDRALAEAGHRSIVVARADSVVRGELRPVPQEAGTLDEAAQARARAATAGAVAAVLRREPVDAVHLHGVDFHQYLPPPGPPVLATLHLPASFYPADALRPSRPRTWLHGVSPAQHRTLEGLAAPLLAPITNGVAVAALGRARHARRAFALCLGRICPEKGQHLALDAARMAGVPLLLGGEVFPYPEHRDYFAREVAPRLDDRCRRFLGPVGFARKRRLLSAARCLLVPSLAAETASLVAMEALACGTPVIAFGRGALPEVVEHGVTGFLVPDAAAMTQAIARLDALDTRACRAAARDRFDSARMTADYLALYRRLAAGAP